MSRRSEWKWNGGLEAGAVILSWQAKLTLSAQSVAVIVVPYYALVFLRGIHVIAVRQHEYNFTLAFTVRSFLQFLKIILRMLSATKSMQCFENFCKIEFPKS